LHFAIRQYFHASAWTSIEDLASASNCRLRKRPKSQKMGIEKQKSSSRRGSIKSRILNHFNLSFSFSGHSDGVKIKK